jgi:predicted PurR-regulated permease PerM
MLLAGLVVLLSAMKLAASFFVPIAVALFLAVLSYPLVRWLLRRGVPHFLAIILTVLVIVGLLGGTVALTTDLVVRFVNRELADDLDTMKISALSTARWLQSKGVEHAEDTVRNAFDTMDWSALIGYARSADVRNIVASLLGTTVGAVTTYLAELTLVMILMFFILSEAHGTTSRAQAVQQAGGPDLSKLLSSATEIQKYLGVKTILSAIVGALAGIWCWVFGMDYPLLWGLLAFALHFIPAVGALLAGVLPCIIALIKLGVGDATAIALGYMAINFMIGSFVEPILMGRRFGVSTLVIVLSVWFWTWMWNAVGAFLAVPLTIMIKVVLDNSDEFRWIGVAMSKKKVKKGEVILETPHVDESEILGAGASTEPPH